MLEELINDLRGYDRVEVSYKSGVSIQTLNAIMSGANTNPTIRTVEALRSFIYAKRREESR